MTQHLALTQSYQVLDDLLVLELGDEGTQYCGGLLADMGARVIKIEAPEGVGSRHRGPFKDDRTDVNASLYFWAFNLNKESITLDLKVKADLSNVKELARKADILLEDYTPGYLDSLGLGYQQLSQNNPRLIMTSVTPFGQSGPLKDWKGGDLIASAMGGILAGGGYHDDPVTQPLWPHGELALLAAGHWAQVGTLIALVQRDITGEGQQVDISIQESCAFVNRGVISEQPNQFDARRATGRREGGMNRNIKCKDGKYLFPMMNFTRPSHWLELIQWFKEGGVGKELWHLSLGDLEALDADQRKQDPAVVLPGIPLPGVTEALAEIAAQKTTEEVRAAGQKMGFVWMIYNAPDELLEDEQLAYRGFFQKVVHPEYSASYTYSGEPYKFSKGGWSIRRRPPLLGEDNGSLAGLLGKR